MLDYNLENRGEASLYEYVYQQIRDDIVAGRIAAGEHLPSKRAFASHLGISVITIENAYSQLLAEGYICSKPRRLQGGRRKRIESLDLSVDIMRAGAHGGVISVDALRSQSQDRCIRKLASVVATTRH